LPIGIWWLGILWLFPLWEMWASTVWEERLCVIRESMVDEVGDSRPAYRPRLRYTYEYQGRDYEGTRLRFGESLLEDRSQVEQLVAAYAPGGEYACYVNPGKPAVAVLQRRIAPRGWRLGLLGPGLLILGGMLILAGSRLSKTPKHGQGERQSADWSSSSPLPATAKTSGPRMAGIDEAAPTKPHYHRDPKSCPVEAGDADQPLILQQAWTRGTAALGAWLFAILWNGVIGLFVGSTWGKLSWFPLVMLSGFGLIGGAAFLLAIRKTLQLWNPRTTLVCSPRYVYPGSEFEISWLHQGRGKRIRSLTITVEGSEQVTYRQGTSHRSENHCFYRQQLVATSEPVEIAQGFAVWQLPLQVMHTFQADRNRILWRLRVHGSIAFWPDIEDEYEITIYPPVILEQADATT
jgi:hypothetical protein